MNELRKAHRIHTFSSFALLPTVKNQLFQHRDMVLAYREWGAGDDVVLCFHGFGRDALDFEIFLPLLRPNQRMIAINLLAHGSSAFNASRSYLQALQPQEWVECLEAFLALHNIQTFHLVGYSMGGRVALCTWQWMHQRTESVVLLATDGLKKNMLYRFASGTRAGRAIYRYCIEHPEALFKLVGALHRLKILPPKLFRFVHVHLDSQPKRQQVYDAWLVYRCFFPSLKALSKIHKKNPVPLTLLFGDNDSIIRPRLAHRITSKFETQVNVIIVPSGHRLFHETTLEVMRFQQVWPGHS